MKTKRNTGMALLTAAAAVVLMSCAHRTAASGPGKWESKAMRDGAGAATIAKAKECDEGDNASCIVVSMYYGGKGDYTNAGALAQEVCDRGEATACGLAEQAKRVK